MGDEAERDKPQEGNGHKSIELSPMQLLAVILRCLLKERITEEEIETICSVYYKTVKEWWG
jgi:hypothetical protein